MIPRTPSKYAIFVPLSPSVTEFRKIPWKHINSSEMGKFRSSAQNSAFRGKLWSLMMASMGPGARDGARGLWSWKLSVHFYTKEEPKVEDLNDSSPPVSTAQCILQPRLSPTFGHWVEIHPCLDPLVLLIFHCQFLHLFMFSCWCCFLFCFTPHATQHVYRPTRCRIPLHHRSRPHGHVPSPSILQRQSQPRSWCRTPHLSRYPWPLSRSLR